jgi:hypothetical protein
MNRNLLSAITLSVFALTLGSCTGNGNSAITNATDSIEVTSNDSVKVSADGHFTIMPKKPSYSLNSLKNVVVPASFELSDFDWDKRTLTMTVYYEDLYDGKAVDKMRAGDTIIFDDRTIIVEKIEWQDSLMVINDGPTGKTCHTREEEKKERQRIDSIKRANGGHYEYGALLEKKYNGEYRSVDDPSPFSVFHKMGKVTLPLSKDFVFINYKNNDEIDQYDTIRVNHQQYMESREFMVDFICCGTLVKIENGVVTSITRSYVP